MSSEPNDSKAAKPKSKALRLTLHYEDCSDAISLVLKMKIPKKWRSGPIKKLCDFFVESYNSKFPDDALDPSKVHFTNSSGRQFHADDIIEESFIHKEHIYIKDGAPPVNEKKLKEELDNDPMLLTCQRYGCQARYREEDNHPRACYYHEKAPVFWNGYKYWGCCPDRKEYNWSDFMRVPGCRFGPHTTVKPKGSDFASPTVLAARQAEMKAKTKNQKETKLNDITQYTKKTLEEAKKAPKQEPKPKPKLPEGCAKCVHWECKKMYVIAENNSKACKYHAGRPVFHDGAKWWTCCSAGRKAYDWDTFMKIPKCRIGFHWDGKGTDPNE